MKLENIVLFGDYITTVAILLIDCKIPGLRYWCIPTQCDALLRGNYNFWMKLIQQQTTRD